MVDKLPVLQGFFAFLSKNERAVYFTIIFALGSAVYFLYNKNDELYGRIQTFQNATIEHERKKTAVFEDIVTEQIRQQLIREQMLKEQNK